MSWLSLLRFMRGAPTFVWIMPQRCFLIWVTMFIMLNWNEMSVTELSRQRKNTNPYVEYSSEHSIPPSSEKGCQDVTRKVSFPVTVYVWKHSPMTKRDLFQSTSHREEGSHHLQQRVFPKDAPLCANRENWKQHALTYECTFRTQRSTLGLIPWELSTLFFETVSFWDQVFLYT